MTKDIKKYYNIFFWSNMVLIITLVFTLLVNIKSLTFTIIYAIDAVLFSWLSLYSVQKLTECFMNNPIVKEENYTNQHRTDFILRVNEWSRYANIQWVVVSQCISVVMLSSTVKSLNISMGSIYSVASLIGGIVFFFTAANKFSDIIDIYYN